VHLGYGCRPVRDLVNRPEIEDSVERFVRCLDSSRVPERNACSLASREPTSCTFDHVRVDIDQLDVRRAEAAEDDLAADAASAAELERPSFLDSSTETRELGRDHMSLDERPRRAVQPELAQAVELHRLSPCVLTMSNSRHHLMRCCSLGVMKHPCAAPRPKSSTAGRGAGDGAQRRAGTVSSLERLQIGVF
jgi:hypothetical protein